MTRTFHPGGWYVDALPSGEWAVLHPGARVDTHRGAIPLIRPSADPLYLRCTNVGGFRFAGQAHDGDGGYEWIEGSGWRAFGPPCCGVNPVIYDRDGVLHISDCSIGSQGYRYVTLDNRLVTGDQSYGPRVGLTEWSATADLLIGQGHAGGGCLVFDGAQLRLLENGDCRFIRVQSDGERVAVSFVKPDGAVVVQTTHAELRALPIVGTNVPNTGTPPIPPIPDPIPPKPEPVPVPVPNQLSVVQSVRAKYPTPMGAQHPLFLIEVARATGAKLLRKDFGSHVTLPDGRNVSQDILVFANGQECFDILSDAEGAANPAWQEKGAIAGEYYDVGGVPAPQPQPDPLPPNADLLAEIAALKVRVSLLESRKYRIALVPE